MSRSIPYGRQHISESDIQAVVETLKSDFLTQGPKVSEFEQAFANYIGANHALAISNGTAALHLATMALGVKPGDKVITTPLTFAASANCVRYCGGEVVFADIDPETFCNMASSDKVCSESEQKCFLNANNYINLTYFQLLKRINDRRDLLPILKWILCSFCF